MLDPGLPLVHQVCQSPRVFSLAAHLILKAEPQALNPKTETQLKRLRLAALSRLGEKIRFDFARRVVFAYQDWPKARPTMAHARCSLGVTFMII